jgi:hypothetical protein
LRTLVDKEVVSRVGARWRPLDVLCVVSLLALVVALCAGGASASSKAGADQGYSDPVGDAGVGTDITNLSVSNDAGGTIVFQVQSASPVVSNHAIAIFIDADRNPATGSGGDDYWFFNGPLAGRAFFAWNGSAFVQQSPASFTASVPAANLNEFRIGEADLGGTRSFFFAAISVSIDPPDVNFWDIAPNTGEFAYTLSGETPPAPTPPPKPIPVKPVIGAAAAAPTKPAAGKRAVVTFPVTRSDTGAPMLTGKMTSAPTIAGKAVAHVDAFKGGMARVSLMVPASATRKQLKVKVTIKLGAQSSTRTATYRIT